MHRVAIIEDLNDIAKSIGRFIDHKEHLSLVGIYNSAESALDLLPVKSTDIVLMDIGLPKMDGIECMLRLKEIAPNLSILMFTVFDTDDKLFDALRFGADGYILKGDGIRGVAHAIEDLISGGAPMSREIAKKVLFSMRSPTNEVGPLTCLTDRQNDILRLIAGGLSNQQIADRLDIKEGTVKQHNHAIFKALEVTNRVEARNRYFEDRS